MHKIILKCIYKFIVYNENNITFVVKVNINFEIFFYLQFDNASQSELWSFFTLSVGVFVIYTFWGYLKTVFLSLKLSGPAPVPILGNCLLIKEKNCKF